MKPYNSMIWTALLIASPLLATDFGDFRNVEDSNTKSHFVIRGYRSLGEWLDRREQLQRQILVSAGLWPLPEKTPLHARRVGRRVYGKYAIEKVVIETFPGLQLAGNLYLPVNRPGRAPGILVAHGHWKNGRVHNTEDYSVPALCVNLAAQGYVAFAWDMLGYNDTTQLPHEFGNKGDEQLWSFGPLGIQLWNSIRALDFLESLPDVDPQRLAITGASGGGTQTFLLSAVDERIHAAAPVDMVSASFQGDDACEMAPGLRIGTNNMEFAALMAPRPLLLVSSTRDWTKNTPAEEFPEIRAIYRLYGKEENVGNWHVNAPHNYNRQSREAVYQFFHHIFGNADGTLSPPLETEVFRGKSKDLLIGDKLQAESNTQIQPIPGYRELFRAWRRSARKQMASLAPTASRTLLRETLHVHVPKYVDTLAANDTLLLEPQGSGDRVPARWIPPVGNSIAIVIHSLGSDAAMSWREVKDLRDEGFGLLFLDVYQTGAAATGRPLMRGDYLVFHPSDDAQRVQDILTGLAWARASSPKRIRLVCDKPSRLWCWAAAAAEGTIEVTGPAADLAGAERELSKSLFVPGIFRIGGLALIRRLAQQPASSDQPSLSSVPAVPANRP